MNTSLWATVALAGALALASPVGLTPLLRRHGVVDVPNARSSHVEPTLRGGGFAQMIGFCVGGLLATVLLPDEDVGLAITIVAAALAIGLVGLSEDVCGLPIRLRAALQFVVGGIAVAALSHLTQAGLAWVLLGALFFAANVNFTNFMDGVNGISGLHGVVVGGAFATLGTVQSLTWLQVLGLTLAVVYAAFLPWNLTPPGLFLGDVGSYLLGGAAALLASAAILSGVPPVAALAPLAAYWMDTVTTLTCRAARREPVFRAHRSHAYQRLTDLGISHLAVALTIAQFTLASSVLGLLTAAGLLHELVAGVGVIAISAAYVALPRALGDRLPAAEAEETAPIVAPAPSSPRNEWVPLTWAVLGASGFIGGAVAEDLEARSIAVRRLPAPRLELDPLAKDGRLLAELAGKHPAVRDLASALHGAHVVVNAAGLAAPDAGESATLTGANALLPAVVAMAAARAGVARFIHLSSAAVQGARPVLDASADVAPFSAYSRSKALGEATLLALRAACAGEALPDIVIVRATSVQGAERATTERLRRIARSPLASVAFPGDQPTVVSSATGLAQLVWRIGVSRDALPAIVLQPWEGLTVRQVLQLAGGRDPVVLPRWLCRLLVALGNSLARPLPRLRGAVRRVEMMWFGQAQETSSAVAGAAERAPLEAVLAGTRRLS